MFSLNVPLPSAVDRLADRLHPQLARFDRVRERHSLVCKRIGVDVLADPHRPPDKDAAIAELRTELRPVVRGTGPFHLEITGIDAFEEPTAGPGPVVYLVVESEPLVRLHWRLVRAFGAIEELEGEAYVPHVTLARGLEGRQRNGQQSRQQNGQQSTILDEELDLLRAAAGEIDVQWRVDELDLWDPEFRESAGRIRL